MATTEYAVGSINDIPGRMAAFALAQGWSASVRGNTARIRRPLETTDGEPDFDLVLGDTVEWEVLPVDVAGLATGPVNNRIVARQGLTLVPTGVAGLVGTDRVNLFSPRLNGSAHLPEIPRPTKLHCFGVGLPRPFLAFVIEYGFNQYRHVYLGTLDRVGSYKGGDCAAVTNTRTAHFRNSFNWTAYHSLVSLFRATQSFTNEDFTLLQSAGVYLGPGSGGDPFRRFMRGRDNLITWYSGSGNVTTKMAFGGWGDGFDDLLLSHAFADYSGEQLMFPINLYSVLLGGVDTRFRPAGACRGVRNVNMQNLEPGQLVTAGGREWRVFPALAKSVEETIRQGPQDAEGFAFPTFESSLYVGHAYPLEGA